MRGDELTGIGPFLAAVEAGSFAAAALQLGVTRSAVGKSISRLETRLSVRLFHRTTRQQTLTDEGARYYEHCSRLVGELRDIESALHDTQGIIDGRVRISAPVLFGRRCVAPVLRSLLRSHAGLEIYAQFSDRVVDVLADGFDLAIRIGSLPDSTSLVSRKLGVQRMAVYASPAYLSAHGIPQRLEDLGQHRGILYGRSGRNTWRMRDGDGTLREVFVGGREHYDDLQVVADSAIDGGGLAWLPSWLGAGYVASGDLALVVDSDRVTSVEVHAVWPHTSYLPQRTRVIIDALVERVPVVLT